MEVGTIQNETLELGTIQFFGIGIRHISIRWKRNKAHFILWYWNKGAPIHGQELKATVPDPDRTPLFSDLDQI